MGRRPLRKRLSLKSSQKTIPHYFKKRQEPNKRFKKRFRVKRKYQKVQKDDESYILPSITDETDDFTNLDLDDETIDSQFKSTSTKSNIKGDSFYINSSKNIENGNNKGQLNSKKNSIKTKDEYCPTLMLTPSSKDSKKVVIKTISKSEPKHVKRNQNEIIPILNKSKSKANIKKLNINNINNINNIREEEEEEEEKDDCDKIFRIEILKKYYKKD